MDFICLKRDFKLDQLQTFENKNGIKPYIQNDMLYIPIEMLNEKYINYYNVNKNSNRLKEENEENEEIEEYDEDIINLNKIQPTGLVNIGGICYLNAVLQCFFYCKPLTKYFLQPKNLHYFKNDVIRPISNGYYEFVKGLSSGNTHAASKFKKALMEADDTFIGKDGKDSKDVAVLLLSAINDELQGENKEIFNTNSNLDHSNLKKMYEETLKMENKKKTIITETFNYLIKYEQKCKNGCPKYYKKYFTLESDNILIFELEKIYKNIHESSSYYERYPEISLEECLQNYKQPEFINCPYCGKESYNKNPTLKVRKAICSLPKIFIFVLSRGFNIQFDCKIKFNEELDMKYYYEPIKDEKNIKINTKYKLIGATFAYDWTKGTRHTGHTVAFCKSFKGSNQSPQYYIFNDSSPRKTNINEISEKVPYLLFYQKCE